MTSEELAVTHFFDGYNCTQAVLAVFCHKYRMAPSTAYKLACGLGTGLRAGQLCGALTGAVIVIGLKDGPEYVGDTVSRRYCHGRVTEFINAFQDSNNSMLCRGIPDEDVFNEEKVRRAPNGQLYMLECAEIVKRTVTALEEMGY